MIGKHLKEIIIKSIWFSQSGESINIKRKRDANVYTIKKDVFLKTSLGKIIGHSNYAIYLKGISIKFDDNLIVEWYGNNFARISDFICNLQLAKEIIAQNAEDFNDEVDTKYKELVYKHKQSILNKTIFSKLLDAISLSDVITSLQLAIDDTLFITKYISFLDSSIRDKEMDYEDDYYNYEYDYENIHDFIDAKKRFLDKYKNKYFSTWPVSHDWLNCFITNLWTYNFRASKSIKLVLFSKDKDVLSKLNEKKYTYVFCKTNDFTKSEIDFLLLTFYKKQNNKKLFVLNYLKQNESNIFKSLL